MDGTIAPSPKKKEPVVIGTILVAAVLLGIVWWAVRSKNKKARLSAADKLPDDASVVSEPLLTESEMAFYNLLQIATQDHYLIFAQVPLRAFVALESSGRDRIRLFKHLALKRVNFALMHPGSRRIEQVVHIEEEFPSPTQEEHQRVIEFMVGRAGIKLVKVRSKKSYTIPELATLLGLATEE